MNRLGPAVLFVCAYLLSIAVASAAHADYILRDAVVGVSVVVVIYAVFLAPAALVAAACFLYPAFPPKTRLSLALLFATLVGLGVHILLLAAQSPRFKEMIMNHDVGSFIALSTALSVSFVVIAAAIRKVSFQR